MLLMKKKTINMQSKFITGNTMRGQLTNPSELQNATPIYRMNYEVADI